MKHEINKIKARLGSIPQTKLNEIKDISIAAVNLLELDIPYLLNLVDRLNDSDK